MIYFFNTNFINSYEKNYTCIVFFEYPISILDYLNEEGSKKFFSENLRLENVLIFIPSFFNLENIKEIKQIIIDEDYFNFRPKSIELKTYSLNSNNDFEEYRLLFLNGIAQILKRKKVVIESDDNFHFILPSTKHSKFFIRTANLLTESIEINFIALSILISLKGIKFNRIICDSASILQLGYAINFLNSKEEKQFSEVKSFGSYHSYKNFNFSSGDLILISASNSGDLGNEIEKYFKNFKLNIFYILLNVNNYCKENYLVNLSDKIHELNINTSKRSMSFNDCEYCKNNSIPVFVNNEHFIPTRKNVQSVLFKTYDFLNWAKEATKFLHGYRIISINKNDSYNEKIREISFNISDAIKLDINVGFSKGLDLFLRTKIPFSIDYVCGLQDESSNDVADYILNILKERNLNVEKINQKDLISLSEKISKNKISKNMIVASSCVSSGTQFYSISRDLRNADFLTTFYLTVISRQEELIKNKIFKSSLEYKTKINYQKSEYLNFIELYLPNKDSSNKNSISPWELEIELYKKNDSFNDVFFLKRIKLINYKIRNEGLINNVFLQNIFTNKTLVLNKNFSFYDFKKKHVSQADVYFVISMILHSLRNPKFYEDSQYKPEFYLTQHEFNKSVISIENFLRFNDGLIQSCILRASKQRELDYTHSVEDSLHALKILKSILIVPDNNNSNEAILEFLLAISLEKIKILNEHLTLLIESITKRDYKKNEITLFLNFIEQNIIKKN